MITYVHPAIREFLVVKTFKAWVLLTININIKRSWGKSHQDPMIFPLCKIGYSNWEAVVVQKMEQWPTRLC